MSARRPTVGPADAPRMTPTTAGPPDTGRHLVDTPAPQVLRHESRRADLLETDLGMGVDVAADRCELAWRLTIGRMFHEVLPRFDPVKSGRRPVQ